MYRLTRIPGILNLLLIAIAISLTGCGSGGGGGGDSASTPPVIQPPIIQNPLNGVWTFANGVQIDTNPDSDNPLLTRCQRLDKTIWQFPISSYKLVDQTQTNREVQFGFGSIQLDSLGIKVMAMGVSYPNTEMQWGSSDSYNLVAGMDGGIYCMKMKTGTGHGDFEIASIDDSPRMFLPPTLNLNTVWVGGIRCQSTMITENTFEVSPSLVNGCYRLHQTLTDPFNQNYISVQWYFLRGSGFVDRVNTVTHQWCTRTPAANG